MTRFHAALAFARRPQATYRDMRKWLTVSARPISSDGARVGAGLIHAAAMVKAAAQWS